MLIHVHRTVELGQLVGQQPDVGVEETQFQRHRLPDVLPVFALVPAAAAAADYAVTAAAVFGGRPNERNVIYSISQWDLCVEKLIDNAAH